MTRFPVSTPNQQAIYGALELSKNSWLLAIQVPGRDNPSRHRRPAADPTLVYEGHDLDGFFHRP